MTRTAQRTLVCSLLILLLAGSIVPGPAAAQLCPAASQPAWGIPPTVVPGSDATLYETTENARFVGRLMRFGEAFPRFRKAKSQLLGVALRGSPLCPNGVPGTGDCTINATGLDSVALTDGGAGNLIGTFTTVVQDTNLIDSPEVVVLKGHFVGTIDFAPALDPVSPLPFGTVTATLIVDGAGAFPFTGTFRQPVDVGFGCPVYYTGSGAPPVVPTDFTAVNPNEFAIGFPAVRFEITFPLSGVQAPALPQ